MPESNYRVSSSLTTKHTHNYIANLIMNKFAVYSSRKHRTVLTFFIFYFLKKRLLLLLLLLLFCIAYSRKLKSLEKFPHFCALGYWHGRENQTGPASQIGNWTLGRTGHPFWTASLKNQWQIGQNQTKPTNRCEPDQLNRLTGSIIIIFFVLIMLLLMI